MGTKILRPRDCFMDRFKFEPIVPGRIPNYDLRKPSRRPENRAERRRSPVNQLRRKDTKPEKKVFMENVTILKRGEFLDKSSDFFSGAPDLVVASTDRLGPEPDRGFFHIPLSDHNTFLTPLSCRQEIYAGAAFSASPSPSSLPLPSFTVKKETLTLEDSATKDLRRLLGIV